MQDTSICCQVTLTQLTIVQVGSHYIITGVCICICKKQEKKARVLDPNIMKQNDEITIRIYTVWSYCNDVLLVYSSMYQNTIAVP